MTLTLDQDTLFKVTAHPVLKGNLWVKYEPNWAKGRKYMLWTRYLGRTDRHIDGQTDNYSTPVKRSPN